VVQTSGSPIREGQDCRVDGLEVPSEVTAMFVSDMCCLSLVCCVARSRPKQMSRSHSANSITQSTVCNSSHSFMPPSMNSAWMTLHSFHWHVQNATTPCHSQELLPFLSVTYFFLPPFSPSYSSILSHLILPSISCSTSQFCCFQIHI